MDHKLSWQEAIKSLEKPLATWLQKSYLTPVNDNECVLFVDKHNHSLLNDLAYLSKIYGCAKLVHPTFKSLHIANTPFLEYLKSQKIELYSLEII